MMFKADFEWDLPSGYDSHSHGESKKKMEASMGKSSIHGPCSMAMLNNQGIFMFDWYIPWILLIDNMDYIYTFAECESWIDNRKASKSTCWNNRIVPI